MRPKRLIDIIDLADMVALRLCPLQCFEHVTQRCIQVCESNIVRMKEFCMQLIGRTHDGRARGAAATRHLLFEYKKKNNNKS